MNTSATGIVILKEREACKLVAYQDQAGVWTLGYGTTHYPNGKEVQKGDTCTAAEANEWFMLHITSLEKWLDALTNHVLIQRQFDALISFAYNLGRHALETSTLLRLILANAMNPGIRIEIMRWHFAGGKENRGLWNRRHDEADQYEGRVTPCPVFPPDLPRAA